MRYLLIYRVNIADHSHSGVLIKMKSQKKALEALGHEVSLINHDGSFIYLDKKKIGRAPIASKRGRYWYNFHSFFNMLKSIDTSSYDCIYIRYPFSNPTFLSFCQVEKRKNPTCRLVIEMPTFPYNKEFKGLVKGYAWIDNYYREKLKSYVDFVVHYGVEQSLFGIPVIRSSNGISVKDFIVNKSVRREKHIRLVAVGKWSYWHGLDRLIVGLRNYCNQKKDYKVDLTIVGEGDELPKLKNRVSKIEALRNSVCFVGIKTGEELDAVFDQSDIAVGTLGMHRKEVEYNASLKHREYCARGVPFILSTKDHLFPEDLPFVKYTPMDDSPIDVNDIIDLYQKIIDKKTVRKYAEEHLDWVPLLKEITDQIFKK